VHCTDTEPTDPCLCRRRCCVIEPEEPQRAGVRASPDGRSSVTAREAEVLKLVLARYTNAEIAALLNISKRTVESHMAALLRKFAVPDRTALIRAAATATGNLPIRGNPPQHALDAGRLGSARARASALRTRVEILTGPTVALHSGHLRASVLFQDAAARQFDDVAYRWTVRADEATDRPTRARALHQAGLARERAESARSRAALARQRLVDATPDERDPGAAH
jgi:DNA-binding CsgD family transcriptional regulator